MNVAQPTLDLSQVTFIEPFALVYLGMFLRHHNNMGRSLSVALPESLKVREYLARQNFWERFNFNPSVIKAESLLRFTTSTSLNNVVDIEKTDTIAEDIADQVLILLRRNRVMVDAPAIAEIISELVDNFAQHSERTLAAFIMQYYPNAKRVDFAIGDCGIGIRTSLATNPRYAYLSSQPHYEAALRAFEQLVSRKIEGGTGLTEVRDGVIRLGGGLSLSTGDGYVRINPQRTTYGTMDYNLLGVQVELWFQER